MARKAAVAGRTQRGRGEARPGRAEARPGRGESRPGRREKQEDKGERRRGDRSRGKDKMEPMVLLGLIFGVILLFAFITVLLGNRDTSPPPEQQAPVQMLTTKIDKDGNTLTPEQVQAIEEKNRQIREANEKIKKAEEEKKTAKKTAAPKPEEAPNLAAQMYRDATGRDMGDAGVAEPEPTATSGEEEPRPVPGWMKDNTGRPIVEPTPEQAPRRNRVSPLAPWKNGGGSEMP